MLAVPLAIHRAERHLARELASTQLEGWGGGRAAYVSMTSRGPAAPLQPRVGRRADLIQENVHTVGLAAGVVSIVVHQRARGVDELPPTLDRDDAGPTEHEVHAVAANPRLDYGVADEAFERKVLGDAVH